ncbi:hypothetical protein HDC36_001782 [Xanthomonas sp. JAI131]|uniref:hypothetical protein n=1 Tax=Xanthomonas sp. JAI131 TaxID=2723067 RepID=UPI0015C91964|nr:hypothetical protein [Xanthomonas sp. JAI131]NYF20321.1 hypothetical protein [Xanthomonas sp. JAI131]
MSVKWKQKYNPKIILEKIDKYRTVTDSEVTFSGFDYQEHMAVLASMLEFPVAANGLNKSTLIWKAIRSVKGALEKDVFIHSLNGHLGRQLSNRITKYSLISSLSLRAQDFPKVISILDCKTFFLGNTLPKKFSNRSITINNANIDIPTTPINYCFIRIDTTAKSAEAAAQKAIDALDFLRGILALRCNFTMEWSFGGGKSNKPINRVRAGGFHTLHHPDGTSAGPIFWYEPNFKPTEKIYKSKTGINLGSILRSDLRSISQTPYEGEIKSSLINCARSLDEKDPNTAFVKLWSALESLMSPKVAKYDDIIRRCSFLYTENDYHRQVLEHLRDYRNRTIHAGSSSEDARTNCYLLQEYFRTAIHFYVGNRRAFSSIASANEFLDLPPDKNALEEKLKMLRKAIKFVTPEN